MDDWGGVGVEEEGGKSFGDMSGMWRRGSMVFFFIYAASMNSLSLTSLSLLFMYQFIQILIIYFMYISFLITL